MLEEIMGGMLDLRSGPGIKTRLFIFTGIDCAWFHHFRLVFVMDSLRHGYVCWRNQDRRGKWSDTNNVMFMHFGVYELSYTVGVLCVVVWSTDQLLGYMISIWTLEKTRGKATQMSRQLFFKESCRSGGLWTHNPHRYWLTAIPIDLPRHGSVGWVQISYTRQRNGKQVSQQVKSNMTWSLNHQRRQSCDWHSDRQGKANPWSVIFQRKIFALDRTWTHNPQIHGKYIIYVHVGGLIDGREILVSRFGVMFINIGFSCIIKTN